MENYVYSVLSPRIFGKKALLIDNFSSFILGCCLKISAFLGHCIFFFQRISFLTGRGDHFLESVCNDSLSFESVLGDFTMGEIKRIRKQESLEALFTFFRC